MGMDPGIPHAGLRMPLRIPQTPPPDNIVGHHGQTPPPDTTVKHHRR